MKLSVYLESLLAVGLAAIVYVSIPTYKLEVPIERPAIIVAAPTPKTKAKHAKPLPPVTATQGFQDFLNSMMPPVGNLTLPAPLTTKPPFYKIESCDNLTADETKSGKPFEQWETRQNPWNMSYRRCQNAI